MHHFGLRRQRAFHKKIFQENKKIQLTLLCSKYWTSWQDLYGYIWDLKAEKMKRSLEAWVPWSKGSSICWRSFFNKVENFLDFENLLKELFFMIKSNFTSRENLEFTVQNVKSTACIFKPFSKLFDAICAFFCVAQMANPSTFLSSEASLLQSQLFFLMRKALYSLSNNSLEF